MKLKKECEWTVYTLQRQFDEFKGLSYDQLMKICELLSESKQDCKILQLEEEVIELRDEVEDLERRLENSEYDYHILLRERDSLKDEIEDLKEELSTKGEE